MTTSSKPRVRRTLSVKEIIRVAELSRRGDASTADPRDFCAMLIGWIEGGNHPDGAAELARAFGWERMAQCIKR